MKLKYNYSTAAILAATILSGCASSDKANDAIDNVYKTSEYSLTSKNSDAAHVGAVTARAAVSGFNDLDRDRSADLLINSDVNIGQTLQLISMFTGRVSTGEGMTHIVGNERNRSEVASGYTFIKLVKFKNVDTLDHASVQNALIDSRKELSSAISFAYKRIGINTKTIGPLSDLESMVAIAPYDKETDLLYACPKVEKASEINYDKEALLAFDNSICSLYSRPSYQVWKNDLEYSNILPKGDFTVTSITLPVSFPLSELAEFQGGDNMFVLLPEESLLIDSHKFKYLASLDDKQKSDVLDHLILKPLPSVYSLEKHTFLEYGYN